MSYGETRNAVKQTAQESEGMNKRTVSLKMVSSSFSRGRQARMSKQMSKTHARAQVSQSSQGE